MSEHHASPDHKSTVRQDVRDVTDHWEVSGFSRTMPGEHACGDAVSIYPGDGFVTVLVVDGLGHGTRAHEASSAAVAHVTKRLEDNPRAGLESLLLSCHKALHGTRGAALALCRLEPPQSLIRFCGVGNIAMTSHPSRRGLGVSLAGVVGYRVRKAKEFVCDVESGDVIALYSDGISSSFSLKALAAQPPDALLATVEKDWAKDHDDATFVTIRFLGEA